MSATAAARIFGGGCSGRSKRSFSNNRASSASGCVYRVSNKAADTPGCFLYTEADFVCYYFVGPRKLYVLPMPATRDWFAANLKNFKEVATTTPVRGGSYTTVGRLVKIERVLDAVRGVRVVDVAAELSGPHPWLATAFARLLARLKFWR